ncbi:MAG: class I SAM-dependent methyltransferase [Caldilineaceae bacterium]
MSAADPQDGTPHPGGFNDPAQLRAGQYATAGNLNARIALHERFSTNHYGWQRFVFDQMLTLPPTARLLEVGCGSAALWRENLARMPAGWQVTLTDLSPGMWEQAQSALAAAAPGDHRFHFETADAMALPFADASLDALVANHMLYHVPNVPQALAEFRRLLRPGGRLFAATNGSRHMLEQWALVAQFAGESSNDWHTVLTRAFSLDNGAALLGAHFSHVERLDYDDALVVTEVEPLVAYVASMSLVAADRLDDFASLVARELAAADGALRIRKETGLFVAW